jgi:hypothetical protein
MSSKDRETSTPRQRNRRRQDREQRAESQIRAALGSPSTARLEPLGGSSFVSPYPEHARRDISTRSQGDGISDHKETEEEEAPGEGVEETKKEEEENEEEEKEEEEEEEGQVSDGNTNNKTEDNSDNDQSHNSTQSSTMAGNPALPFDPGLTHIVTNVYNFQNPSTPIQSITEYGITTFDELRSMDYDHKWEYKINNAKEILTGIATETLSIVIAWARDLESKNHADKDDSTKWKREDLLL